MDRDAVERPEDLHPDDFRCLRVEVSTSNGEKIMACSRLVVTSNRPKSNRLPDWARRVVVLLEMLRLSGALDDVGKRLCIRRWGYCALDIFVFLLAYFASDQRQGLKKFWQQCRPVQREIAAVAGRKSLPSPASVSRALDAVESDLLRPVGPWLLRLPEGFSEVLHHPAVLTTDTHGVGWHFFDFDHTATTQRQRALPGGSERPKPRRHAKELAPGYSGRKRGDVQLTRATLQHSGSGLYVGARIGAGNGDSRADFEDAVRTTVETCAEENLPLEQAVLRSDGAFGNVPCITACQEQGLRFISRSSRYHLLHQGDVQAALKRALWYEVPRSTEGESRYAAEAGWIWLAPGEQTRRADGNSYESVRVRLVVTRRRSNGDARPRIGHRIGEWVYELFVTDLDASAWPAPELVESYYARTAQENRFHQEDRELELDRIFSYHLPGQEFASLVGLLVWNMRLVAGFKLEQDKLADFERPSEPREARHFDEQPSFDQFEPVDSEGSDLGEDSQLVPNLEAELAATEERLRTVLRTLDCSSALRRRPGWTQNAETGRLVCSASHPLRPRGVEFRNHQRPTLQWVADKTRCGGCASRDACITARSPGALKRVMMSLDEEHAQKLSALLDREQRLKRRLERETRRKSTRVIPLTARRAMHQRVVTFDTSEAACSPGNLAVYPPMLAPAAARQHFDHACQEIECHIVLSEPRQLTSVRTPLLVDRTRRRRERLTWAQRRARYALPDNEQPEVRLLRAAHLSALLGVEPELKRLDVNA